MDLRDRPATCPPAGPPRHHGRSGRLVRVVVVAVVLGAVGLAVRPPGWIGDGVALWSPPPPATQSSEPMSSTPQTAVAELDAELAADPTRHAGVAVLDTVTGTLTLGAEAQRGFAAASLAKLLTVVAVLHRAETGAATLTGPERAQVVAALRLSDDQAMNALWGRFGGPGTIVETVALAGLHDTRPPADPRWWGRTIISARDVVAVYEFVATALTPPDRDLVMGALASAPDTAEDGFDQAFGLLRVPRPAGMASKQGWMVDDGAVYLHSAGRVGRWVVVLLSERPATDGFDRARVALSSSASTLLAALPTA